MYWEWEYQETKLRDKEKAGKIRFMVKSVSLFVIFYFHFLRLPPPLLPYYHWRRRRHRPRSLQKGDASLKW